MELERREAEIRAKREEEERKRLEEALRARQEEERKRLEEEELARQKQVGADAHACWSLWFNLIFASTSASVVNVRRTR